MLQRCKPRPDPLRGVFRFGCVGVNTPPVREDLIIYIKTPLSVRGILIKEIQLHTPEEYGFTTCYAVKLGIEKNRRTRPICAGARRCVDSPDTAHTRARTPGARGRGLTRCDTYGFEVPSDPPRLLDPPLSLAPLPALCPRPLPRWPGLAASCRPPRSRAPPLAGCARNWLGGSQLLLQVSNVRLQLACLLPRVAQVDEEHYLDGRRQ